MKAERSGENKHKLTPPSPSSIRWVLHLVGWNALWIFVGLALIVVAGEIWFRLTVPFAMNDHPSQFVPGVGIIRKPFAEMRHTNNVDSWTVSRTNSLGFLDREPPSEERSSQSCHVAIIGDSFVEGREVSISDRVQVQLEALAARDRPDLDVTTSAFGISGTSQISQLPYYDEFARRLHPKLLVLVFVRNDVSQGVKRAGVPFVTVKQSEDGTLTLRPPDPNYHSSPIGRKSFVGWVVKGLRRSIPFLRLEIGPLVNVIKMSYFAQWLEAKIDSMTAYEVLETGRGYRLEFTAFALDQFKKRTDRDGVSLAILASSTMRAHGDHLFNQLSALAEERGVPVIDQYDYIVRQGAKVEDTHWTHDEHWNPAGHRYAAEALLEYLKQNPTVCTGSTE